MVVSLWFSVQQIPTIFLRECLREPDFVIFSHLDTPEAVTQLQDSSPDSWQVAGLEKSIWNSLGLTRCSHSMFWFPEPTGCAKACVPSSEVAADGQDGRGHLSLLHKGQFSGVEH